MRKGWRIATACIVLGLAAREAAAQTPPITAHLGSGSPDRVAAGVAMPGTNETNFQLCSFGISVNADDADRLQRVVRQETLKVLFE